MCLISSLGYPAGWLCLAWLALSRGEATHAAAASDRGLTSLQSLAHLYSAAEDVADAEDARDSDAEDVRDMDKEAVCNEGQGGTDETPPEQRTAKGGGRVGVALQVQLRLEAVSSLALSRSGKPDLALQQIRQGGIARLLQRDPSPGSPWDGATDSFVRQVALPVSCVSCLVTFSLRPSPPRVTAFSPTPTSRHTHDPTSPNHRCSTSAPFVSF